MKRNALGLQVPTGTADILPREQGFIRTLENKILDLFTSWAYEEVETPTFEYLAAINPTIEKTDSLYKFFDRDGAVLALRPEMTTPIARMIATRLRGNVFPLRICYSAEVFRYEKPPARREFRQAGVELVGSSSPLADAEVIALAVDTLRNSGVQDFQLNLGHIEIFRGLIEEMGLDELSCKTIEDCLARKDFVALELYLVEIGLSKQQIELIVGLPSFHGGDEVLERVGKLAKSPRTLAALDNLREVYEALKLHEVCQDVAIDLGILRGFDYYTGVVFEGYAPGLGFPVCEGGRYDGLLNKFGLDTPATGFAVNLERLVSILEVPEYRGANILVAGTSMKRVIVRAGELRAEGKRVETILVPTGESEAREYAALKGIALVEVVD
ncbi:MAG TPA: ATP phosphoribosyltransferase regulatory subunit [Verrucomicrobiae bacterium]|nr:ATP phosphoribosyltransferase regulatory subunit [Verrucomicrobiae bacterium]